MKAYVGILDEVLPELFFFIQVDPRPDTLLIFVFCLADGKWEQERSTATVTRRVAADNVKRARFIERRWPGLNAVTNWLEVTTEENKKISYAIARKLGFQVPGDDGGFLAMQKF